MAFMRGIIRFGCSVVALLCVLSLVLLPIGAIILLQMEQLEETEALHKTIKGKK